MPFSFSVIYFQVIGVYKNQELRKFEEKNLVNVALFPPSYLRAKVYPLKRPEGVSKGVSIIAFYLKDRFGIFI